MIDLRCDNPCQEYQELITENTVLKECIEEAEEFCNELRSELEYLECLKTHLEGILEMHHIDYEFVEED
ncbi:MAG: hypothetical protein ACI3YU_09435 [Segatella copri]